MLPALLIIAGLDPSGGAGLAADIETASALGVHAAPVASLLTIQDTVNVKSVKPLEPEFVVEQAKTVLSDINVGAIKLGALGTAQIGRAVAKLLQNYPQLPVVTDPVLVAAGGGALAETELINVYKNELFPLSILATPNREELETLAGARGATSLIEAGLSACLVTDGEGAGEMITHELHTAKGIICFENGKRRPGSFHGSGCTLASAIAAQLAQGDNLQSAIKRATSYVEQTIIRAYKPGKGQMVPGRNR